jgi:hypothetical protein
LSRQPATRALQAGRDAREQWLAWLRDILPAELRPHLVGAAPRRGTLIVYAASAAWSTRLRYALAGSLAACQARDAAIRELSVRVLPPGGVGAPRA